MTRALGRNIAALTGTALIVLPLLALAIKLTSVGWAMFGIMVTAPLWIIGYALQVVIAANGFLSGRGVLREGPAARRAMVAAWASGVGVMLAAFFLVDAGDVEIWGSPFMLLIGHAGDGAMAGLSTSLFSLACFVWLAAWLWLVVEWIAALVSRRRARRLAATATAAAAAAPAAATPAI